jgi:hypothetical protein
MTRRFEAEPRAVKPNDYDGWFDEIGLLADSEGFWPLMIGWNYAPIECCQFLQTVPGAWASLETRARFADTKHHRVSLWIKDLEA